MSRPRIGAVTIGQTPRPDLLEPVRARAAADVQIVEVGALDGLAVADLPTHGSLLDEGPSSRYPLTTRLRDGARVTLDEADLAPLVQRAIDRAEDGGAEVTLLLCAGGFLDVTARGNVVRPFDAAVAQLRALGGRRPAVVVPYAGQVSPSRRKWEAAGFEPTVLVGDPATFGLPPEIAAEAIVLDYVGHALRDVEALRTRVSIPVIDLGEAGADAAVAPLAQRRDEPAVARR